MIHDTSTRRQDDITELTTWEQLDNPLFEISELDVVPRRDNTCFVESAIELDHDLAVAVVINFFELANIA